MPDQTVDDAIPSDANTDYDEDQWGRTLADGESLTPGDLDLADHLQTANNSLPEGDLLPGGDLPDLDKVLQQVPASSRELIDALFRGRFVGVQIIDRKRLY